MEETRNQMTYNRKALSDATAVRCKDKSRTQQEFAEEADINVLVERFGIRHVPEGVRVPMYGDFTVVRDYRTALESLKLAEDSFMQMSAKVRARFENDPQKFLDFCADAGNKDEMRAMGLLVAPVPEAPEERRHKELVAAVGAPRAPVAPPGGGK